MSWFSRGHRGIARRRRTLQGSTTGQLPICYSSLCIARQAANVCGYTGVGTKSLTRNKDYASRHGAPADWAGGPHHAAQRADVLQRGPLETHILTGNLDPMQTAPAPRIT